MSSLFCFLKSKTRAMTSGKRKSLRLTFCADSAALMVARRWTRLEGLMRDALGRRHITRRFAEEIMLHLSLVLGFPSMIRGMELVAAASPPAPASRRPGRSPEMLRAIGERTFRRVYGSQSDRVLGFLDSLGAGMSASILEHAYGSVFSRRGLSLAEREVLTIVVLCAHRHRKQLYGHLRGALRSGLTRRDLGRILTRLERIHGLETRAARQALAAISSRRRIKN